MIKFKKTALAALLLLAFQTSACDICGSYMGQTPYQNKHSISFLHRYRVFNGYRDYQTQSLFFPPSAYKTTHGGLNHDSLLSVPKTYSSKDYESYKIFELRFKYFIHKRMELNLFLPFINNKSKTDNVYISHSGISDISINSGFHLILPKEEKNIKHKLLLGIGVKLATGNCNAMRNGVRLPFEMQAGSGSYDGFVYINYMLVLNQFGINTNLYYKINNNNRFNERLGNSHNDFASLFYKLSFKSFKCYPSIQANYEYTKGLYIDHAFQKYTGTNSLLIGPGIDIYFKAISINFCWQYTVADHIEPGELKSTGRINFGINYSFNRK